MRSTERNKVLTWLAEDTTDQQEYRVVTNVHCLSEDIDFPALEDAFMYNFSAVNLQQKVQQIIDFYNKKRE